VVPPTRVTHTQLIFGA
jgi:serine/threonine protein kinase